MASNIHADSLISNTSDVTHFGGTSFGSVGNIQQGGQLGLGPRIMQMDGATPLPFNAATIVMLQGPSMWKSYPTLLRSLKALMELHARGVDGIDFGYQTEFSDVPVGHDGQNASMPTITKRTPVNPSFTWDEIYGNLVWNIHALWLKHINHPDTTCSLLSSLLGDATPNWVWTTFSASFIVIQPDPTGLYNRIVDASVYTNVIPTETGMLGLKRAIGESTIPQRTIAYKAIVSHNESTRELGRLIMQSINMHKPNYDYATTFSGVSGELQGYGLNKTVQEAIADFNATNSTSATDSMMDALANTGK